MTRSYRVIFDISGVEAESKQEAAEFVRELISNGGEIWTWGVKDEADLSDEGEDIEA